MTDTPRRHVACSFCGKRQDQVRRLIAGPRRVFICDQCVQLCTEIIAEGPSLPPPSRAASPPTRARARTKWWQRWLPDRHQRGPTLPIVGTLADPDQV